MLIPGTAAPAQHRRPQREACARKWKATDPAPASPRGAAFAASTHLGSTFLGIRIAIESIPPYHAGTLVVGWRVFYAFLRLRGTSAPILRDRAIASSSAAALFSAATAASPTPSNSFLPARSRSSSRSSGNYGAHRLDERNNFPARLPVWLGIVSHRRRGSNR